MKKIFLLLIFFCCTILYSQDLGIKWIKVDGGEVRLNLNNTTENVKVDDYFISSTEISFEQYLKFCQSSNYQIPSDEGWSKGKRPVINVSWNDAVNFCKWLSKETGSRIRLPNEAEWEYAALGGNKSKSFKYSGSNDYNEVSWVFENSNNTTQPVGTKKANELGIFDMSGNVFEWCYTGSQIPVKINETETDGNVKHAVKGTSFDNPADDFRVPAMFLETDTRHSNIGFRVIKEIDK